ncbi:elongation factor G-like protein EF-G2 [Nocardioides gansuensis]|uniref:Elongation factor G-like protein EF-G2 n=1 Tax=Nocardioides gansuensis TaxID=2138300 RepID=A0A2T8FDR9_9ACTN|nr:elongation factor G-like protein EF-G2 [Nocardioides gansuensis]PVG83858.1 elongation factor G-like protein EF-G2 [Nocardioides gansuensis]
MGDKNGRRATDHDLSALRPDRIRNVVLVGPTQSGKTSLVEALLHHTGAISRPGTVADGTTVSDHEDVEQAHGRSVSLSVAPLVHEGVKVNLVDTPGFADFVGEVRAGLRAADCALFVIASHEGVDDSTRDLWRECAQVGMPRALVLTKLDHARADVDTALAAARSAFGEKVLPVYVLEGDRLTGLLSGATDDPRRGELVEAVIEESEDETLMDRYVGGEQIDEKVLVDDLETAIAHATLFPVVPVCATTGVGLGELLDLCVRAFPSPPEHAPPDLFTPAGVAVEPVTCDPAGPLVAEVVKTSSDHYLGRVSLVRVFSGALRPDVPVHVSGHFASFGTAGHEDHDEDERVGALAHPFGARQVPTDQVVAGDIGLVARLSRAETGDTLSSTDDPRVLRPWEMPDPLLPVAIEAASRSDEDKLSAALSRLAAEDPSLRVEHSAETGQLLLWVMGEAHAEVALERLRQRYGVTVTEVDVVVPLRECLLGPAKGHGRHVKQSGGHGQYAVCDIEVEPLPEGSGFAFESRVVGGSVPRQFIPSVEKGVRQQMDRGVRLGYPVVDLRVVLVDGKAHSVDSSDMAFQTAGALALKDAAEGATVAMLEPYDEVSVLVSDDHVGSVMSDLSARRGRLLGTEQADDRTVVRAIVPQRELLRYAVDLRSATHGAGTFTRTFAHYEPMPEELAVAVPRRRT